LPRLKVGLREQGRRYAEYYDDASRETVAGRHHRDIDLFGYSF
jgi:hypothetical protein